MAICPGDTRASRLCGFKMSTTSGLGSHGLLESIILEQLCHVDGSGLRTSCFLDFLLYIQELGSPRSPASHGRESGSPQSCSLNQALKLPAPWQQTPQSAPGSLGNLCHSWKLGTSGSFLFVKKSNQIISITSDKLFFYTFPSRGNHELSEPEETFCQKCESFSSGNSEFKPDGG